MTGINHSEFSTRRILTNKLPSPSKTPKIKGKLGNVGLSLNLPTGSGVPSYVKFNRDNWSCKDNKRLLPEAVNEYISLTNSIRELSSFSFIRERIMLSFCQAMYFSPYTESK